MKNLLCLTTTTSGAVSNVVADSGMDFSAVFLIISLIVAVALPIGVLIYGKVKTKGSIKMTLWGIVGYVVFYIVLAALLTSVFLRGYSDQSSTYFEATVYVVIQFICLELSRFLILNFRKKKHGGFGDALLFGAGYCICDTIIIAVCFLVPYLVIILSPNGGSFDGILRELRVYVKDANLVEGKEWRFIVKALTSFTFCAMQMSSAILMYIAIAKKEKWMLILPFAVDALIMIPNRLSSYDVWYFGNNFVIIPYLAIMAVLCCLFTYMMYKRVYMRKETTVDTSYFEKLADKTDKK